MTAGAGFWTALTLLAIGTFLMRYALIGLFAHRAPPERLRRVLRHVPAAVLPAIAAPLLLASGDGAGLALDPIRLTAAAAGVAAGLWTGRIIVTIAVGMGVFSIAGALV